MMSLSWLQIGLYFALLLLLVKPLGAYMVRVYQGERAFLDPLLRPVERLIYHATGVRAQDEMSWKTYAAAMLVFNQPVFTSGDLTVDLARRVVTVAGREVQLTPTEYDLLRVLAADAGKVLTHRQLLRQVWGVGYDQEVHMLSIFAR